MRKKYQLILIFVLFIATAGMLGMVFKGQLSERKEEKVENVQMDPVSTEPEEQENTEPVTETVENVDEAEKDEEEVSIFTYSDPAYFDDALFIGDSRTVGLYEYGTLKNADYFATTGMSVYEVWEEKVSVEKVGRMTLKELLHAKSYSKIYIMLGINELGYEFEKTVQTYKDSVSELQKLMPEAYIFICANLHVGKERSDSDDVFNNKNIDRFNQRIKEFADNESIFYIDVNQKFDDENGNLKKECSNDSVHVQAKYYAEWCAWLCENTVQRG